MESYSFIHANLRSLQCSVVIYYLDTKILLENMPLADFMHTVTTLYILDVSGSFSIFSVSHKKKYVILYQLDLRMPLFV